VPVHLIHDPTSSFGNEVRLQVLSNTPWRLYVSVKGLRVGGKDVRPEEVILRVGERRVTVGGKETLLVAGDRGVWPLRCELSVTLPPEVDGSGEVVLVLSFSVVEVLP